MGLRQVKSAHLEIREYTYDGLDSGVNPRGGFEPPGMAAPVASSERAHVPALWSYWQLEPGVWVNQWQEQCVDEKLLAHFATLPANVYKVEADRQMIALCWGEKGEVSDLQAIDALLKALA